MKHEKLKMLITVAMLSALAYAATFAFHSLPIPPVVMFLKFDPKDVIIAIGGFIYGPFAALIISCISSFFEMITISTTGWWGLLMNILSSVAFASTAALIYKRKKTFSRAVIGIIAGCIMMTATMLLWNYFITPYYLDPENIEVTRQYVSSILFTVFLPFNLLKSGLNASLTILLYKPVISALRAAGFVKKSVTVHKQEGSKVKKNFLVTFFSLLAAIVFVGLMILLNIMQ